MRFEDFDRLVQDGRIARPDFGFIEVKVYATQDQLLMLDRSRSGRWRRRRRSRNYGWWRWRRNQWIANLVTNHGANYSTDHGTSSSGGSYFRGIRMRFVEERNSQSGAGSGRSSDYTAGEAAGAPSARRRRLS